MFRALPPLAAAPSLAGLLLLLHLLGVAGPHAVRLHQVPVRLPLQVIHPPQGYPSSTGLEPVDKCLRSQLNQKRP